MREDEQEERVRNLARHLGGDNRGAVERELQRAADEFHSLVPAPREPVTVISHDGRITITMNPPGPA